MIAELKPYPAYKDSGVPWLGEVPEHWEVRRIKTLFREKDERSGAASGVLLSLTRARGIVPQAEASNRIASADDLSKYKVCRPGDLVMNRMQAWSGMFAVSSHEGLVSPDYCVFGVIKISAVKYFEQLFKTPTFVSQFAQRSKGIGSGFNRLYTPDFGAVPVLVPPVPEQFLLVHYLNHLDRRIYRYIRAKQELIKLLEEQKQAIIHRAVTRGLDPNVRLKPSGVEWLGDVPEHWEVRRIRNAVDMRVSNVDKHTKEGELPVQLCNYVDVYKNDRITERVTFMRATALWEEIERFRLELGDVLITKDSEAWNDIGIPALVEYSAENLICGYHLALLRPRKALVSGPYLLRALQSPAVAYQFHVAANGVTRYGLSHNSIKSVLLPIPPIVEQAAIVRFLDEATAGITSGKDRAHREIALLHEYRTRLIADVVTGKLDVREAAVRLPEETDEPEPLNEADALNDAKEVADDDLETAADEVEA